MVVYDDPYFYPSYRYRANRVVMVGPRNPTRPRFDFKERAEGDPGTPVTVVRQGRRDDFPPLGDGPRTGQGAGTARVASPSVVPPPTTTRRRTPSGRAEAPQVRPRGVRVTPPLADDREPRRPTLERRSAAPSQGAQPRRETARPRPTQPRPSTRRPPERPRGASSARPAPRARPPTPPPDRGSTRPPPRRPPGIGTR